MSVTCSAKEPVLNRFSTEQMCFLFLSRVSFVSFLFSKYIEKISLRLYQNLTKADFSSLGAKISKDAEKRIFDS